MKNTTTISLNDGYGSYTVEVDKVDMSMDEVFQELVIPVLLASGYQRENINQWITEE